MQPEPYWVISLNILLRALSLLLYNPVMVYFEVVSMYIYII